MSRRAFTLIEIIAVIAVIGFLFAVAVVKLDGIIPSARVKKQSRSTADLIELAFTQAAIEGRDLALRFDAEARQISLEYYFEPEEEEDLAASLAAESEDEEALPEAELKPLLVRELDEGVNLAAIEVDTFDPQETRDFIVFRSGGTCDGARLTFRGEGSGYTQQIEVWPLSGRVEIGPLAGGGE